MRHFKTIKILAIFLLSFVIIQGSGNIALADAAGPLTYFGINYYSCPLWIQSYGNDAFAGKEYASHVAIHGSTVYLVTDQAGLGNIRWFMDDNPVNNRSIPSIPDETYTDSYGNVTGFRCYSAIDNVAVGTHTFKAICFGTGYPSETLSDSITINFQN